MVRCLDCGFFELSSFSGLPGTCVENINKTRKLQAFDVEIKCKNFVEKRKGWQPTDYHEWKDRHLELRRTTRLTYASLSIALGLLIWEIIKSFF